MLMLMLMVGTGQARRPRDRVPDWHPGIGGRTAVVGSRPSVDDYIAAQNYVEAPDEVQVDHPDRTEHCILTPYSGDVRPRFAVNVHCFKADKAKAGSGNHRYVHD